MAKKKQTTHKTDTTAAIADAFSEIESLKDELQEWYDNLPENFQNGSKGEQLQEAIGALEQHSEPSVDDKLQELLEKTEVSYLATSGRASRSDRRYAAIAQLDAVIELLQEKQDEQEKAGCELDYESLIDELTNARDEWDNVEFPGMFG